MASSSERFFHGSRVKSLGTWAAVSQVLQMSAYSQGEEKELHQAVQRPKAMSGW